MCADLGSDFAVEHREKVERAAVCGGDRSAVVWGGGDGRDGSGKFHGTPRLSGSMVENMDEFVAAAGDAEKAVACHGDGVDGRGMLGELLRGNDGELPEPQRSVRSAGGELHVVRMEADAGDSPFMSAEQSR